jgi:hypothetical protein
MNGPAHPDDLGAIPPPRRAPRRRGWLPAGAVAGLRALLAFLLLGVAVPARAELQFDAFVGYGLGANEGLVAEGCWFPVVFEVYNDGPGFAGVIELNAGPGGQRQRVAVELPTGTRKRILMPRYSSGRYITLNAELRDAKGRLRAERSQLRPRQTTDRLSPLIGSLSRTLSGAVFLPEVPRGNHQLQPGVARLSVDLFPDNVIALEGLSSIYLHSSKALELKAPQITALLAWLHAGGHLILGVEQPGDVNSLPWLAGLLPCQLTGVTNRNSHDALQAWLNSDRRRPTQGQFVPAPLRRPPGRANTNALAFVAPSEANPLAQLEPDSAFETATLPVAVAAVRDGRVLLGTAQAPLAVQAARGRGTVTVLLFSPELEPFRSWKNRPWFWARLADVPIEWLAGWSRARSGGYHVDGVLGALTDSKQIRKLPMAWLFVLLLAYLAVIGPVDQYVLKRLNRQMLTWLTFPAYVALFSLLIYYIGYRLRAGEAEWNEFHVVDVILHGARSDQRGHAYGSIYSPINAQYPVACEAPCADLRGEVGYLGGQEVSKAEIDQQGNTFKARLDAPIWTSQLYVTDWWRQTTTPLQFGLTYLGTDRWLVTTTNLSGRRLSKSSLVLEGRLYPLGELGRTNTFVITRGTGTPVRDFARAQSGGFAQAVEWRSRPWGSSRPETIPDPYAAAVALSFLPEEGGTAPNQPGWRSGFTTLRGLDLTGNADRGDTILLAWMPGELLLAPMNKFTPKRSSKQTLLRVLAPSQPPAPPAPEA